MKTCIAILAFACLICALILLGWGDVTRFETTLLFYTYTGCFVLFTIAAVKFPKK